jgi:hypothetical protein
MGEIKTVQPIVGRRQSDPGLGVARTLLDRATEAFFGEIKITAAEIFLAELQVVVGIVAEVPRLGERRDRLPARAGLGRLRVHRARGVAVGRCRGVGEIARRFAAVVLLILGLRIPQVAELRR